MGIRESAVLCVYSQMGYSVYVCVNFRDWLHSSASSVGAKKPQRSDQWVGPSDVCHLSRLESIRVWLLRERDGQCVTRRVSTDIGRRCLPVQPVPRVSLGGKLTKLDSAL